MIDAHVARDRYAGGTRATGLRVLPAAICSGGVPPLLPMRKERSLEVVPITLHICTKLLDPSPRRAYLLSPLTNMHACMACICNWDTTTTLLSAPGESIRIAHSLAVWSVGVWCYRNWAAPTSMGPDQPRHIFLADKLF